MPTVSRIRTPSPASLILIAAGTTQDAVARRIGRTQPTVSAQLSGDRTLQPETLQAIRQVAGPEAAEKIAAIHGLDGGS